MKVTNNKMENRTAYLTVEMEQAEVEQYMESSYKRMVGRVDIPGFRKGNAPREVLEKHVGRDKLLEEARKELMPIACSKAIKEQGLEVLTQTMVKIVKEEPLVFEMVVPLVPVVEIGDYQSIRMQLEPVEITDKDVDNVLEDLRHQSANYEPVDRPVKLGDMLTIDVEGTVMESPFIRSKGTRFSVQPEYPPEIPGLYEHFIGMKKDEVKEFKHKLPEDYANKIMAGKEVSFKVKVLEIKGEKLSELDDNFARMIAPDLKTLDSLRERIAKNMKIDYEQRSKNNFEEKLVEALIRKSKLEVPPFMIESEAEYLFKEGLQQLQASCKSKEEYEDKLKQLSIEQVQEEYRSIANKRILWNLVLARVAKKENIEVSDSEIDEEIEYMIQGATDKEREEQRQFMNEPPNCENVKALISTRKTIGLLTEIATSPEKKTREKKEKEAK